MFNILLLTPDPQMLCQIPEEWKKDFNIHLSPQENTIYDACFSYELVPCKLSFKIRNGGKCIFIPGEPKSIKGFSSGFLQQFDNFYSFREDLISRPFLKNKNLQKPIKTCVTPWRVGLSERSEQVKEARVIRTVKQVEERHIKKSKLISMVVSNKTGTPMQRARLKLLQLLINHFPNHIDFYGRGFKDDRIKSIDDKADALDDYMFSIAVENSQDPGYITEKLTDCFITGTVPLYSGAPNVDCFYASKGFLPIDVWSPEAVVIFIRDVLLPYGENIYKELLPYVLSNRHTVLYKYSIIGVIKQIMTKLKFKEGYRVVMLEPDTVGYFW